MSGEAAIALAPGATFAGYTVVRLLGAGGFGAVYEAVDARGERHALKHLSGLVAHPRNLQNLLSRFRREARICQKLRHPGIVSVTDHGVEDGVPYLVMRLLQGQDLEGHLRTHGPLDAGTLVTLAMQACEALAYAHDNGIVHRDLKPANVFLEDMGAGQLRAVLCDFGIAKAVDGDDESLTETGALLGTALYMSPEQCVDAGKVDARSDVWSLGMTLYAALAGRSAFEGIETWSELVVALMTAPVPSLQDHAPWLPASVVRAVHAALLRDPARRYPSARALRDALERTGTAVSLVEADTLHATPPSAEPSRERIPLPESAEELAADAGGQLVGGLYRVVSRLGGGGMGEVFEAESPDGARVAVKLLKIATDSGLRRRFAREVSAIGALASPHVTRLVDSGVDAATAEPFLVMELLRGVDLARLVEGRGALRAGPLVHLMMEACEGLQVAHDAGIVHRDLKPANLFFAEQDDGTVVAKVCDFGIAKRLAETGEDTTELTQTGGILGSPAYMSPEQAQNAKDVDARTDVWSLGLTLYQGLSGQRPWAGKKSTGELILAVCTQDLTPLETLAPWVDPALTQVIQKATRRDRGERFPSMRAFQEALRPFAAESATLDALGPLTDAERALRPGLEASSRMSASGAFASTHVPPPPPRRITPWLIGLAAALPFIGVGGYLGLRPSHGPGRAPDVPTVATASPLPTLASTTAIAASAPLPSTPSSAPSAAPRTGGHAVGRPSARASASVAPSASAIPVPTATSNVGRGVTATDLPFPTAKP